MNTGNQKPKQAWYKKWWVIALAALLVIGGISRMFNPTAEDPDEATTPTQAVTTPTATPTPAETVKTPEVTTTPPTLGEYDAQDACTNYGGTKYKFGFNPHWVFGVIAGQYSNDEWFVKAKVTIENGYGNKYDTVVECRVSGTPAAPVVTYFYVY